MKEIFTLFFTLIITLTYAQEPSLYLHTFVDGNEFELKIFNISKDTIFIRKDFSVELSIQPAYSKCNTLVVSNKCYADANDVPLRYICIMPFDSFFIEGSFSESPYIKEHLKYIDENQGCSFDTINSLVVEVYYLIIKKRGILLPKAILFEGFYFEDGNMFVRTHLCGIMRRVDKKTEVEIILPQKRKSTRIFKRKSKSR